MEALLMRRYHDPNESVDAPIKREILFVLLAFVVATAAIAAVINLAI